MAVRRKEEEKSDIPFRAKSTPPSFLAGKEKGGYRWVLSSQEGKKGKVTEESP